MPTKQSAYTSCAAPNETRDAIQSSAQQLSEAEGVRITIPVALDLVVEAWPVGHTEVQ